MPNNSGPFNHAIGSKTSQHAEGSPRTIVQERWRGSSTHFVMRTVQVLLLWVVPAAGYAFPSSTVRQSSFRVPVSLRNGFGRMVKQDLVLTVVRDRQGDRRRPFLVLLHGRPASVDARIRLGQVTSPGNASFFAGLGFVVLIPTRVGYGVTGGPDLEYTGTCFDKDFSQGMTAVVEETRQVLEFASHLPDIDRHRGLVVGDSFGGVAAVAIASARIPGVVAAINISGGDGGDSVRHVDHPCRPDQMSATFAAYGRSNRLPTLWMYSVNDRLWGPLYPKIWFRDFTDSGGRGQFVTLPADKNNGHFIFNRNPGAWHPAFDQFIQSLGFDRAARRPPKAANTHGLSSGIEGNREKSKHAHTDVIVSPAAASDQPDVVEHDASTREEATDTSARRLFSKYANLWVQSTKIKGIRNGIQTR
ncbi:dienelactone hydrolase family protein [Thiomonas sp. FB-Cd]|uniref:dienelactone hydrolase family protein n=1 Tax=Thiomonas sp. FB-Cd TaxID=1158292 RepID=UPI00068A6DEE|nr:hypothetical protein [Thiomonas sp. FB-Cd]